MRFVLLFQLLFYCVCLNLFAQDEVNKNDIIAALRRIRTKLEAISFKTAIEKEKIDAIRTQINFAILNIEKDSENFPKLYLQSLVQLAEFIESANKDTADKKYILDILAKDIELKFSRPPDNLNSISYIKLVKVSVMTYREGKPIKNLRIHYNGLGYAINYGVPNYSFKNVTGPVQDELVPGYYVLWATLDGDEKVLGQINAEINPVKENKITIVVR